MKNIKILLSVLFILCVAMYSCDDIVEENLEKERITLISPTENLRTTFATQTYSWNEVEGADQYAIQIVDGSFSQPNFFVVDSNLSTNRFVYNLSPGSYQWRVLAKNSVSQTPYSTRTIVIDSTSDLRGQSVLLSTPSAHDISNDSSLGFNWQALYNADAYVIQIRRNTFAGALVYTDTLSSTDLAVGEVSLEEGKYGWGIKATNSISSTAFSSTEFTLDYTLPNAPSIKFLDTIYSRRFTLNWTRNSTDIKEDNLFIYGDSSRTDIRLNVTAESTYTDSVLSAGTYYWRVRSIDFAGNVGAFSVQRKLEVR